MNQVQSITAENLANQFAYQGTIFHNALVELTDEKAKLRINNITNPINWLLGHLMCCRYMLAQMVGAEVSETYNDIYFKGYDESKEYMTLQKITELWEDASHKLITQLSSMSEEQLNADPHGHGKVKDTVAFFLYHEAYHLGQIGLSRKAHQLGIMKSN